MISTMKAIKTGFLALGLVALIAFTLLVDLSLGDDKKIDPSLKDDQFESFVNWAVEYAIEQQKASEFQLTPYEEMDFWELEKLLRKPWEEKWKTLWPLSPTDEIREQTIREDDEALLQLFRESLSNGHHSEAWIYFSLLHNENSLIAASREAYDAYIEGYEGLKSGMEDQVAGCITLPMNCLSRNGLTTSTQVYLTTEGVKEQFPDRVARLYAGPVVPRDWPVFPTLQVTFGLSDGSDSPLMSNNFEEDDIRHYDRTPGDSMRENLDWMVRRGSYRSIIDKNGLEAAKEAFRENLLLTSVVAGESNVTDGQIGFFDLSSFSRVGFVRTSYGMVQITQSWDFLNRCIDTSSEEAESSEESLSTCNEVCAPGSQCLTEEEAKKKCIEEKKCCGEPSKASCSCDGNEEKYCFKCGCPECQADSSWSESAKTFLEG